MLRPYIKTAVEITLDDPDDPVPYWLVSTRHPHRLARNAAGRLVYADRVSESVATAAVEVLLLQLDTGLEPPTYAHPDDAGADLRSTESFELQRENAGWSGPASPSRYRRLRGLVHPRSGLAARHGISIVNAPGTVDGYRGEIKVHRFTDRSQPVSITRGDRVAQLVIQPVSMAAFGGH